MGHAAKAASVDALHRSTVPAAPLLPPAPVPPVPLPVWTHRLSTQDNCESHPLPVVQGQPRDPIGQSSSSPGCEELKSHAAPSSSAVPSTSVVMSFICDDLLDAL